MKLKHIFTASLSACVLGLSSCDLNITPDSYIPDGSFYKNEAEMNTAVIGCYGGMQAPLNIEWTLTELRADNTRMNSNSATTGAGPRYHGCQQCQHTYLLGSYLQQYQQLQ